MMINSIKSYQNLFELCEELRLENPHYLRDFHNKNCHPTERIEGNSIAGKQILIPAKEQIAKMNREIRKSNESFYNFPVGGKFPFLFNCWEGVYTVSQTIYLNDEIKNVFKQTIRLDLELMNDTHYYFRFTAFDFIKNEEASDSKISTLAQMCIETIYPIRIVVSSHGEITDIELTKTPARISSELEKVKQFFTDDYAFRYIEKMKGVVEDPKEVFRKFKNTLIKTFLFGSFYQEKLGDWTTSQTYHNFYPWVSDAQPICFEFQNTLCPKENLDDEFIKIKQKGISCDYRSLEELFLAASEYDIHIPKNEKSIDCEHFAEYVFTRENHSLQRIEATFLNFVNENIEKRNLFIRKNDR